MSSPVRSQYMPQAPHLKPLNIQQQNQKPKISLPMGAPVPQALAEPKADYLKDKAVICNKLERAWPYEKINYTLLTNQRENVNLSGSTKTNYLVIHKAIRSATFEDPSNVLLRFRTIKTALQVAGMVFNHPDKRVLLEIYAKGIAEDIIKENYFNPLGHYGDHLYTAYEGISCIKIDDSGKPIVDESGNLQLNMEGMKKAIFQLKRAIALDPTNQEYATALVDVSTKLKEILESIKIDGKITNVELIAAKSQLDDIVQNQDPFKDEFVANTDLFKLMKQAPKLLTDKYPHLKTPEAFINVYPETAVINTDNFTYKTFKADLEKAMKNPLATVLVYVSHSNPILAPSIAMILEKAMICNPRLRIKLAWSEDFTILCNTFRDDKSIANFDLMYHDYTENGHKYFTLALNPKIPVVLK